ncbi:MAG: non-canonical purine NTP pyrophosphatase [Verrucomicrobia bacterium]|nr:MAG: non-canonical purine NTP pyrophosphatase [Verrucomicrobiota bacterium]
MKTILVATRNAHKNEEIQAIFAEPIRWLTLRDFPQAPEVVEDAPSFQGNAAKKAEALADYAIPFLESLDETYVLADDSGLEVDALEGAPGVYSARFAHLDKNIYGNAPDHANNAKLLNVLANLPESQRTARFRCVLALISLSGLKASRNTQTQGESRTVFFEGTCEGRILQAPQGGKGFGYDPLFAPTGFDQSFGELGEEFKNRLSHRACALQRLKHWFNHPHP